MNVEDECIPLAPTTPEVVTWIHLGDLHMLRAGEPNFVDLQSIVKEINVLFAGKGVSFVYLPGDVADDGSESAYSAVRTCLDQLALPWCAVVGDHDVHGESFCSFQQAMSANLYGAFSVGKVRFFRLNCFSEPQPDSFCVSADQLSWLEAELERSAGLRFVLLMHCYPSDVKEGGDALTALIRRYGISVVDMGHTHYNELSNDGSTVYCATRSTGQIEEGPVGYSILTLDGDSLSWHFKRLGTPSLVSITAPQDLRLHTEAQQAGGFGDIAIRVLAWSTVAIRSIAVSSGGYSQNLAQDATGLWTATLPAGVLTSGIHDLTATLEDTEGSKFEDKVRIAVGVSPDLCVHHHKRDQDNALGAWPERELLGTQLGPNKNGRKW